ncbi:MAG: hypothetical protein ACR2LA_07445 [Acidimicrobiales bacterium]
MGQQPAQPPIACSLSAEGMDVRLAEWRVLLTAVTERAELEGGLRLMFEPSVPAADVARLAAAEQECCPFFSFAVTIDSRGTALEVTAPAEAADLVAEAFGGPR